MVAATFKKANTYVFAEKVIHNPKVGGSIPPPATNFLNSFNDLEQKQANLARATCGKVAVLFFKNSAFVPFQTFKNTQHF